MSDKQRKAFEDVFYNEIGGAAVNENLAWEVWQAAVASIVVKIPKQPYYDFDIDLLKDALDEAGVRYE